MTETIRRRRAAQVRHRKARRRGMLAACVVVIGTAAVLFAIGSKHTYGQVAKRAPLHAARVSRGARRPLTLPAPIPGYLLIADRGNNRILLVDSAKHVLWRYPGPGRAALPFRFDDDAFFGPGLRTIISNQEDQHTIQVISFPGGRLLWRYGHVDLRGNSPGYLNTPDDAYLLGRGDVSVADAYNCRVLFLSPRHRTIRQIGSGACVHDPPRSLGPINGATPAPAGTTLVSEISGSWIDSFAHDGRLLWSFRAPVSYPSDPQPLGHGRIMLADYTRPGQALILDTHGHVLWRYGPASGPGMLDHPSLAFPIGHGLVAINDDYRHRVVFVCDRQAPHRVAVRPHRRSREPAGSATHARRA